MESGGKTHWSLHRRYSLFRVRGDVLRGKNRRIMEQATNGRRAIWANWGDGNESISIHLRSMSATSAAKLTAAAQSGGTLVDRERSLKEIT